MRLVYLIPILLCFACLTRCGQTYAQGEIIDDFSKKALPDWIYGGVEMKYSHEEDNKENGFAEIISKKSIVPSEYIGKIFLKRPHLFQAGNFVNLMIEGSDNDAVVIVSILYDLNNDKRYESGVDAALESEPVSMNFQGWKELKIRLDQENFKLVTKSPVGFELTEDEALGVQLDFKSGKEYKSSVFKSGIALVSEIQNKEALEGFESSSSNTESYFKASNSPNPFKTSTTITYFLPNATNVSISVYDKLGRLLEELLNQNQDAGEHSLEFNAGDLSSGEYFYRIKTPEKTEVRKMFISK
jgi:hypothetical protein